VLGQGYFGAMIASWNQRLGTLETIILVLTV
jgi:hypothetical protein